jgi:threonine/homoserine/homoserine lactone efflux protein
MYGVATSLGHGTGIGLWALLTAIRIANLIVKMSGLLVSVQGLGTFLIAYIGFRTLTN